MMATQRDATGRPASARAFADLLRWSRMQSPITSPNPPGEWLVDRRLTQRPPETISGAPAPEGEQPAPEAAIPTSGEGA
jgi:hypothetical protein